MIPRFTEICKPKHVMLKRQSNSQIPEGASSVFQMYPLHDFFFLHIREVERWVVVTYLLPPGFNRQS